tara:strand:+ start:1008 stop:1700 length:693 start_codon:yes stop_codon:yes gene_type:complete
MKKSFDELYDELNEGVYDPNIFKAIFLAGGPGSGKSYVAGRSGVIGQGLKLVNSDNEFEFLMKKAKLELDMTTQLADKQAGQRDSVRDKAKRMTASKKDNYISGRLGLILDGTARDYDKLSNEAKALQQIGYDTYMIFVNTSLDVALERNAMRPRKVPESIVSKSWKAVQQNIGKFSLFFKKGFIIVDNNEVNEDIMKEVSKRVRSLLRQKIQNGRAKLWIQQQLDLKRR